MRLLAAVEVKVFFLTCGNYQNVVLHVIIVNVHYGIFRHQEYFIL